VFNETQKKWLFSARMEDGAAELAGFIVDGAAPKWFAFAIEGLLWTVVQRREVETELPSREDLRGLLHKLRDAAALIERELYAPGVRDFTGWSAFHTSVSDNDFRHVLGGYVARIEVALRSPAVVDESGVLNRGPGPARAPMRPTPQMVVAIMVVEMWRHFRKADPPPNGAEIAKIAERFWVLAGGGDSGKEGEPLAIWRPRLKQAMKGTGNPRVNEVLEVIRAKTQECLETEGRSLRTHLPVKLQEQIAAIVAD
jgi:hypothetical protein